MAARAVLLGNFSFLVQMLPFLGGVPASDSLASFLSCLRPDFTLALNTLLRPPTLPLTLTSHQNHQERFFKNNNQIRVPGRDPTLKTNTLNSNNK